MSMQDATMQALQKDAEANKVKTVEPVLAAPVASGSTNAAMPVGNPAQAPTAYQQRYRSGGYGV